MCRTERRRIERMWSIGILIGWLTVATAAVASHGTILAHALVTTPSPDETTVPIVFPTIESKNE